MIAPAGDCVLAPRFGVIDDARRHQRHRHAKTQGAIAALVAVLSFAYGFPHGSPAVGGGNAALPAATVRLTSHLTTGYTVTFHYREPGATSVRIEGEWYFSSPDGTRQGVLPAQWRPGYFPMAWPNGPYAGWPQTSMKENPRTGTWSYTTPLPSGLYDYHFVVDCSDATLANPYATACGQHTPTRSVYVPPDRSMRTASYAWEAPTSPVGAVSAIDVASLSRRSELSGIDGLAVYTPPGYDPGRSNPYPALYVLGGIDAGDLAADTTGMLDNLIDHHVIAPTVVVFTTFLFSGCATGPWTGYDTDLIDGVIPAVESRYTVSRSPSARAVAGLSCGGNIAGSLLVDDTAKFRAFGLLAPLGSFATLSKGSLSGHDSPAVMVGGGHQDPWHSYASQDLMRLRAAGARAVPDFVEGGQEPFVWRTLLHDFLMRVPR